MNSIFLFPLFIITWLPAIHSLEVESCGNLEIGVLLSNAVHDSNSNSILILGGLNASYESSHAELDQIVHYNLTSQQSHQIGSFPTPRHAGATAVGSNGNIFYFGGGGWAGYPTRYDSAIYRLRFDNPEPIVVGQLPVATSGMSAISTGQFIYLFGGTTADLGGGDYAFSNQILKYSIQDGSIRNVAQLPQNLTQSSAVFDGEHAYIFGGEIDTPSVATNQVVKFNPVTNTVEVLESGMISELFGTDAVLVGDEAYIIGGQLTGSSQATKLTIYNIRTEEVREEEVDGILQFPNQASSVYANGYIYIFRGTAPTNGEVLCIRV